MGNGPKRTPDVPKAPPGAAYSMVAAATTLSQIEDDDIVARGAVSGIGSSGQPQSAAPVEFCERIHDLRFDVLNEARPQLHQAVRLVLASPVRIAGSDGEHIALVADPRELAILQCLMSGYVMEGKVTALAPDGSSGTIRVSGRSFSELV